MSVLENSNNRGQFQFWCYPLKSESARVIGASLEKLIKPASPNTTAPNPTKSKFSGISKQGEEPFDRFIS